MKPYLLTLSLIIVLTNYPSLAKDINWEKVLAVGYHELAVGNTDHAILIFKKKVQKYPSSAACHVALGRACKKIGKIDEAKGQFSIATQVEPQYSPGLYELAVMEESDKQWEKAAEDFKRYMQIEPSLSARQNIADRIKFCQQH